MTPTTDLLPPELALAEEPDITVELCDRCEEFPAEYFDEDGNGLCPVCVPEIEEEIGRELRLTKSEPWHIKDLAEAEWAMRTVAKLARQEAEAIEQAAAWRERIDAWEAEKFKGINERRGMLEFHLETYARRVREADPKAKTLKLPSGRVKSTAYDARPDVVDGEALLPWLRAYAAEMGEPAGKYIKTTIVEAPIAKAVKEIVQIGGSQETGYIAHVDGQPVPGVSIVPPRTVFSVVPS